MVDFRVERLARRLTALENRLKGAATSPQLAHSSIQDGAVDEYVAVETGEFYEDGSPVVEQQLVSRIGQQFDGTHTAASLVGPKPPVPAPPVVEGGVGLFAVNWSGNFVNEGGNVDIFITAPMDFARIEVHVSDIDDFTPDIAPESSTRAATIESAAGSKVTVLGAEGTYYVRLVSRTLSGNYSDGSEIVQVTTQSGAGMTPQQIQDLNDAITTANSAAAAAQTAQESADAAAASVEVAKQAAIDAAAADATAKAEQAEANAAATAAADAQAKADAAQAAAVAAAQTYADAQVSGASSDVLDAAKADATAKADAAKQAAIDAAALDATAKTEAAEAAAAQDAADKADAAKQAAIDAAALDATQKADVVQAAADAAATAAQTAQQTADQAVTTAISKGQVIYQTTAPTGSRATSANLWIDTDDNIPHIYDGTKWVAVTDKTALDAAAQAGDAYTQAQTAHQAAIDAASVAAGADATATTANATAENALVEAAKKGTVYFGPNEPDENDPMGMWVQLPHARQYGYFNFTGSNDVLNPAMEVVQDTAHELFINKIVNPQMRTDPGVVNRDDTWIFDTVNLAYVYQSSFYEIDNDGGYPAGYYMGIGVSRLAGASAGTYTLVKSKAGVLTVLSSDNPNLTSKVYSAGAYVYNYGTANERVRAVVASTVGGVTTTTNGVWTTIAPGSRNEVRVTTPSLANGTTMVLSFQSDTVSPSSKMILASITMVTSPTFPRCFDGSMEIFDDEDPDFQFEWLGTPNNSPSRILGKTVQRHTGVSSTLDGGGWQETRFGKKWLVGGTVVSYPDSIGVTSQLTISASVMARTPWAVGKQVTLLSNGAPSSIITLTATPQRVQWNPPASGNVSDLRATVNSTDAMVTEVMSKPASADYFDSTYPGTSGTVDDPTFGLGAGWYMTNDPTLVEDGSVKTDSIFNGAVTGEKIANQTIATNNLADGAVTLAKLASDAASVDMSRVKANSTMNTTFNLGINGQILGPDVNGGLIISSSRISSSTNSIYLDVRNGDIAGARNVISDTLTGNKLSVTSPDSAESTAGNVPPLMVGVRTGSHLRIDGDRIVSMANDSTQAELSLNDGGLVTTSRLRVDSTTDASTAAGNIPPLRVGNIAGTHLRIDGNEVIAMATDSTQGTLYLNQGGNVTVNGNLNAPHNFQTGTLTAAALSNGATTSISVTFSTPFNSVPSVVGSTSSYRYTVGATNITKTGFTLMVANYSGAAGAGISATWIAVGM